MFKIVAIFVIIILVLILIIRYLWLKNYVLKNEINDILGKKQSLSTKYGKMSEQFMPFLKNYPYDEHNFRFIGNPIDGVQFENDKIVFIEFKTANSKLSSKQREIKDIIDKKLVFFKEFNIR
jgi:predicted Holliday junction resolvase-like endonuclease